ncbi:NUDIX hydrolase [Paenibacillus cremeus]|uniref:NUDIX domain-containing protein n=1 Tax=Paenibacillus cremeus TaxID=2163881 RepID=A0A559K587_9BACL|nr:NUDIX domain-containing protein [Paenibacillus cremeus]TVY07267.1 NUDIX domain-containing protein [Paenibacillus cremeus]
MSKAQELFDIYDEQMNHLGTATRGETHAKGYWHRSFQCWIWTETADGPHVLFQKRHPDKDTHPELLDISCAGHLSAGEDVEDGVRELAEELGVTIQFEELIACGTFPVDKHLSNGVIDREFCHVYLYCSDQPLADYQLQEDEVTGLYRMPLQDMRRMIEGTDAGEAWTLSGVTREPDGRLAQRKIVVKAEDFVPHPKAYYEFVLHAIDTYRQPV